MVDLISVEHWLLIDYEEYSSNILELPFKNYGALRDLGIIDIKLVYGSIPYPPPYSDTLNIRQVQKGTRDKNNPFTHKKTTFDGLAKIQEIKIEETSIDGVYNIDIELNVPVINELMFFPEEFNCSKNNKKYGAAFSIKLDNGGKNYSVSARNIPLEQEKAYSFVLRQDDHAIHPGEAYCDTGNKLSTIFAFETK